MQKHDNNHQHDKFSVQFFHISICLGPQMPTAVPYFFFKLLYVGSTSFRRQTSLSFSFLSFINFLFLVPHSFIYNLYFSCVIFGYFQSSWYSIPLLSKHIYFIGIRRNPIYVILKRVHRYTKAKQNAVLFSEFPDLLFLKHTLAYNLAPYQILKAQLCVSQEKVYTPSS